jgi:hypothetical protein
MRPQCPHRRIGVLVLVGAFTLALAGMVPAMAHHQADHTGGPPATVQVGGGGGSDHDGDADSDPNTALEDSHEPEGNPPDDNAHPSGKDRSAEWGGSANQGKSESDPDGSDNGGIDKPQGTATAGGDLDDQDGNNGCGNDDDFEDDNNGNCGPKAGGGPPPPPGNGGNGGNGGIVVTPGAEVQGEVLGQAAAKPGKAKPAVAGEAELAFTGADITPLVSAMILLFLTGLALLTMGRRRGQAEDRQVV